MSDPSLSLFAQCRQIWQICFGDSETFIDLYFSRRAKETNTFVSLASDGAVASQGQCFLYDMSGGSLRDGEGNVVYESKSTLWGYVSGIATLPKYRGQGHAARVMRQIHDYMRQKQVDYAFLIPADDYAAGWYANHFSYTLTHNLLRPMASPLAPNLLEKVDIHDATAREQSLRAMADNLHQRSFTLQHTEADLLDAWEVCLLSGGGLYRQSQPQYSEYLLMEPQRKGLMIQERFRTPTAQSARARYNHLNNGDKVDILSFQSTPVLTLPMCTGEPAPQNAHFSLLLD